LYLFQSGELNVLLDCNRYVCENAGKQDDSHLSSSFVASRRFAADFKKAVSSASNKPTKSQRLKLPSKEGKKKLILSAGQEEEFLPQLNFDMSKLKAERKPKKQATESAFVAISNDADSQGAYKKAQKKSKLSSFCSVNIALTVVGFSTLVNLPVSSLFLASQLAEEAAAFSSSCLRDVDANHVAEIKAGLASAGQELVQKITISVLYRGSLADLDENIKKTNFGSWLQAHKFYVLDGNHRVS